MAVQHVYGLSGSGMDVDSMVKSLMQAQRAPYDSLGQKKTLLEWKKEAYNTMYTSINQFRNNTVFNFQMQSSLATRSVTSSNASAVTATANADAVNVNHSLTVSQIASGVTQSSSSAITTGSNKTTIGSQFGINGTVSLTLNGKSISVSSAQSINDLVSNINSSGAGVKASYDANLDRFFLYSDGTGSSAKIDLSGSSTGGMNFLINNLKLPVVKTALGGSTSTSNTGIDAAQKLDTQVTGIAGAFNLKINNGTSSTTVAIDMANDSLNDMLSKINSATDSNGNKIAKASYDTSTGKFTIQPLKADGTTVDSTASLDFSGSDPQAISLMYYKLNLPASSQGQDAKFTLDGVELTQNSNKFTIAGVTYNLSGVGTANVSVVTDVDTIVSNVKSFIDSYNKMLSSLNDEVKETKYSDYLPLTDDQKKAMSQDEISAWEAKAKSGLLNGDSTLRSLVDSMRSNLSGPISGLSGKYKSASSIGITTGDYSENGKLYLDEDKLRAALQADPDVVNKIFGSTTYMDSNGTSVTAKGVSVQLYDTLKTFSDRIVSEAGTTATVTSDTKSNLALEIKDMTTRMKTLNDHLNDLQDRYYKQFNAMETALSQLSKQSSYISQLLNSNSNS